MSKNNLLKVLTLAFTLLMLFCSVASANGTNVSGPITSDTTWTLANSPYIVTGNNVLVMEGVTLTIEPGVVVKFENERSLQIDGQLIARGTAENPIIFTSNQPNPSPGDWGYILFTDSSVDATYDSDGNYVSGSILEHCIVEYAGGVSVSNNGAVRINNAHPLINDCIIKNNKAPGIYAWGLTGTFKITNSIIRSNKGDGIYIHHGNNTISNNLISDNTGSGIHINYYEYLGTGTTTISSNIINNNTNQGIQVYYGTTSISNNTISDNSGGGIYASYYWYSYGGNKIDIFSNNIYNNKGCGITIDCGGTSTIYNNNIFNNQASSGGGIYVSYYIGGGITKIYNNTISNNSASSSGGGIYVMATNFHGHPSSDGTVIISNNTITNNFALSGGGIYVKGSTVTIFNNSINSNKAQNAPAIGYYCCAENNNIHYNHIIGNEATGLAPTYTIYVNLHPLINYNNLFNNIATYDLWNDNPQGSANLNAENNWWGTSSESEIQTKIYDWFDDSSRGIVDYFPYLNVPYGLGDNLWNFRYNADDRFHDNEPWLRPWRYDYDDGWGRWVGKWTYEVQWSQTYTQESGTTDGISWSINNNGNLNISGSRDHQWHVWTYVYVSSPKNITIPATGDCVPRIFLNYDFDNPIQFPATLSLKAGWNRIDITGYNQNDGYSFNLNYDLAKNVDIMSSSELDNPFIIGVIPDVFIDEDTSYTYNLSIHEFDLEDSANSLWWNVSGVNSSLFDVNIDTNDILTIIPKPNVHGSDTITLTLTDSDGLTTSQNISVTVFPVNDLPVADFSFSPKNPGVNQTITFNASSSYDLDGTIEEWIWDFGDGNVTSTTEEIIVHSYSSTGDYNVTLTVTDDEGATNSTTKIITVMPAQPSVSISTDKYEYTAGDVMLINITLTNPTSEWKSVKFLWILDILDYDKHFTIINNRSLLLPAFYDKTFTLRLKLPELKSSFNASWHVAIFNATTSELISEDYADWKYAAAKAKKNNVKGLEKSVREIIPF